MQITRHYKYFISLLVFVLMAAVFPESAIARRAVGVYEVSCSGCHGPASNPNNDLDRNTLATDIQKAIGISSRTGKSEMRFLQFLTPAQVDDIALQLGSPSTCPAPNVWSADGKLCQSTPTCDASKVLSVDESSCVNPIATCIVSKYFDNQDNLCIDSRLTVTASKPGSYDSTAIGSYDNSCSGCHGSITNPTRSGVNITKSTITQIQGAINSNAGGVMGELILTPAQIDDIAAQLGTPTSCALPKMWDPTSRVCTASNTLKCTASQIPNADGSACISIKSDLYTTNCASCHGYGIPNKTGVNISNTSVAKIQTAIKTTSFGMGYLSTLTTQQLNEIAVNLAVTCPETTVFNAVTNSCGAPPLLKCIAPQVVNASQTACVRAVGDYNSLCVGCHSTTASDHGTDVATSQKKPRTAAQIQTAIDVTYYGMNIPSLTSLTPAQVDDIAIQLGAVSACAAPKTWDLNGSICGVPPVICTLPEIRNTLTNKCVVAITKAGVVGVAGSAAAGTDVYKVTCGTGTLSLLAAIKDNTQFIRVPIISAQIIKHPHASIPAIDSVDDSKFSSLVRLNGGLGPYTVTVNKEQYIGADLLNKGLEDYTALFSCRNKTSQTATTVKLMQ